LFYFILFYFILLVLLFFFFWVVSKSWGEEQTVGGGNATTVCDSGDFWTVLATELLQRRENARQSLLVFHVLSTECSFGLHSVRKRHKPVRECRKKGNKQEGLF
uniref:hypothetical protein n=1 Tax=Salmonella sp. s60732 TaxID=3160132 RepID=UPI0037552838